MLTATRTVIADENQTRVKLKPFRKCASASSSNIEGTLTVIFIACQTVFWQANAKHVFHHTKVVTNPALWNSNHEGTWICLDDLGLLCLAFTGVSVNCITQVPIYLLRENCVKCSKGNTTRKVPLSKLRGITRVSPGIYRWPLVQCTLTSLVAFPTTGDTRFSAHDSNNMHVFWDPRAA